MPSASDVACDWSGGALGLGLGEDKEEGDGDGECGRPLEEDMVGGE